ncbi:response regulator transcription factor [Paenibacillus sp. NEAU-GSW1]|uniref:response regulator transcription factor n=1 Tax=Paenibacillus sp. NEAU-GSW1 TaxID=2682486 RepID=UPI0012E0DF10|nr:response regulator transcription factor [Paenibacillus sp. NEAU-GSW1]MUT66229.1 response regulator [Paenibacillus sp. NEAU-GSW1]
MDERNPGEKIRIAIVEDDPDWLRGLTAYLKGQPDFELVFTASRPEDAEAAIGQTMTGPPDVMLMDIMLQGQPEGIRLAEAAALATGARVIMLTSMEEKELIISSFQAGAIDYQIKSDFEALPDAIRSAARRASPISAIAAEQMREEFRRLKRLEREFEAKKMSDRITPSELQLLELIDEGYTQTQIADKLVVSVRTVKNHINNLLKKLPFNGSKEAAREVKAMGLFQKDGECGRNSDGTN